jgi:hypothetical protein
MGDSIVSECRPGLFRVCPACGRWFALRLLPPPAKLKKEPAPTYQCRFCQAKTVFTGPADLRMV